MARTVICQREILLMGKNSNFLSHILWHLVQTIIMVKVIFEMPRKNGQRMAPSSERTTGGGFSGNAASVAEIINLRPYCVIL